MNWKKNVNIQKLPKIVKPNRSVNFCMCIFDFVSISSVFCFIDINFSVEISFTCFVYGQPFKRVPNHVD